MIQCTKCRCAAASKMQHYLSSERKSISIDLSKSTLIEVMEAYDNIKRRNRKCFNGSHDVIYNITLIQQEMGDYKFMPVDVTDIFYNIFIEWLQGRGCKNSTIKLYCSKIRTALRWSSKYGVALSNTYDEFDIKVEKQEKIALTEMEVAHIAFFDIEGTFGGDRKTNPRYKRYDKRRTLEKVRDQFVISVCLGQRYSDIKEMLPENFNRNVFTIKQQKTGNVAVVDIDGFSMDKKLIYSILEKYDYKAPYPHDLGNYNGYLHELLKEIGGEFSEMVPVDQRVDGVMERISVPKYKLITSHCGRRTFVTYNVRRGIPEYKIRRASGHSDLKSFQGYICDVEK